MFSKDTVPDRRKVVVDLDGEGKEVLLNVIKVEAIKGMSGNLFFRVTFSFKVRFNVVNNDPVSLSDLLIFRIITTWTIRMVEH